MSREKLLINEPKSNNSEVMRNKQIELLEKQLAFWRNQTKILIKALEDADEKALHYADLLEKTEEELYADRVESEWISVEDRLPEQSGRFLAFIKLPHKAFDSPDVMAVLDYEKCHGFYTCSEDDTVTHWMPLPQAPKGERQ